MLTVPEDFPPKYISYLNAQDERIAETVLMAMKQSVAEGKYGVLVSDHNIDRQAEVSPEVPFGDVVEQTR